MTGDDAECRNCGDAVEGLGVVFCVYGDWDRDRQGFERGDHNFHICERCWSTEYDDARGIAYQTEDADELWTILAASDGQLVADLSSFFIPGPCFARVVDDEMEVCTVNMEQAPEDSEYDLLTVPEMSDSHDLLLEGLLEDNEDPTYPVRLRTADKTPFVELQDDVEERRFVPGEA